VAHCVAVSEAEPAGIERMRELENIRAFLSGQGLFSAIDLLRKS
jgi:ABC-type protease/lipase transport system fused ATPase/permease subunit